MSTLQNQIAVITGGNSGIGRAVALRFAQEGAEVVLFGRNPETLRDTAHAVGGDPLTIQGDVTRLSDIDRLMSAVQERYGRIDVLVANAGGTTIRPFEAADEAHFDSVVDTNLKGTFFTVQRALPLLSSGASVILTTSISNVKGFAGLSAYGAAKAGIRSLARTLAAELAPRGIRVNALSPGPIDTPAFSRLGLPEDQVDAAREGFASQVPLGRMGTADELAGSALFLASSDGGFVTGAELAVDGGLAQV